MYHSLMLLAGMKALYHSPYLPSYFVSILLICISGMGWCSGYKNIRIISTLFFSIGLSSLNANHYRSSSIPEDLFNIPIFINACLVSLKSFERFQQLTLKPTTISQNHLLSKFKGLIVVSNYKDQLQSIQIGWCGEWKVRLKPIHGTLNTHGFDYEKWAYTQSIKARGTLLGVEKLHAGQSIINRYLRYRTGLVHQLEQIVPSSTAGGFIMSLALGERGRVSDDDWKLLRRSGTSHLLAISGLHIGLVFALVFTLTNLLMRLCVKFLLYLSAQKTASVAGLIASGAYLLLSGLPLSGVRAWVMLLVVVLIQLINHQADIQRGIVIALMLLLIIAPVSVLSIGFWLSFSAVAFILMLCSGSLIKPDKVPDDRMIAKVLKKLINTSQLYLLLSVAMLSLSVIFFGELSWVSPLANLIAIPIISLLILPIILIGLNLLLLSWIDAARFFFGLAAHGLEYLLDLLVVLTRQSWSWSMPMHEQSGAWLLACLAAMLYFYLYKWPGRNLLVLSIVPIIVAMPDEFKQGEFDLTVFDVGQGLSIWYHGAKHNLLIDTGFGVKGGFSYSSNLIIPTLKSSAVDQLDQLIISHNDNDHAGGLAALKSADLEIKTLYMSDTRDNAGALFCADGRHWKKNAVTFEFLTQTSVQGENNRSCVLKISSRLISILLPADIEKSAEAILGKKHPSKLSANILIVPHHGSRSSSTSAFLDKVNPQIAIVSAGFMNRYKHPDRKVLLRYNKRKVSVYNTACDGAIKIAVRQSGLTVSSLRDDYQPFWRHKCKA